MGQVTLFRLRGLITEMPGAESAWLVSLKPEFAQGNQVTTNFSPGDSMQLVILGTAVLAKSTRRLRTGRSTRASDFGFTDQGKAAAFRLK